MMCRYVIVGIILCITGGACHKSSPDEVATLDEVDFTIDPKSGTFPGPLLLTRFSSLEQFKEVVSVEYIEFERKDSLEERISKGVRLVQRFTNGNIVSELEPGVSEADFTKARNGSPWKKFLLAFQCSFGVLNMKGLKCIESLGRRRPWEFGKGDVAFYDLAQTMVMHIREDDLKQLKESDLSDKGYLNTFNHVTAQAMMTSLYSEPMADFVADVHERYNLPELVSGQFNPDQIADIENGPVDNYLDMINNEWGQEWGKILKVKFSISDDTRWTPVLLADYLNSIQQYLSWSMHIGFTPFTPEEEVVIKFAQKINFLRFGEQPADQLTYVN